MKRNIATTQTLGNFNIGETKKNINSFFDNLDELKWEQAKLNAQKGLTANCNMPHKNRKYPYITIGKDTFNVSAIEEKDGEIQKHLSGFYWAQSILSEQEQIYIKEYFINGKFENEVVGLLGLNSIDSRAFRKIKHRAIYKFAYVLNLIA